MKGFKESTIAEFLQDVNFLPPTGENLEDFVSRYFMNSPEPVPTGNSHGDVQGTGAEDFGNIQNNPLISALKGIGTAFDSDVADLSFWANYYLFTPEGARLGPEFGDNAGEDHSAVLNTVYPKKNLADVQSASENLSRPEVSPVVPTPFPKHQPKLPFFTLNQPTFIEGVEYPAGTKVFYEKVK